MQYFQTTPSPHSISAAGLFSDERQRILRDIVCLFTPDIKCFFDSNPAILSDISEIRLRAGLPSSVTLAPKFTSSGTQGAKNELVTGKGAIPVILTKDELETIFARLCQGSVYTQSETLRLGFAVRDSARIGVGGRVSVRDGKVTGFSGIESLNIRIPVFSESCADTMLSYISRNGFEKTGGILVISPPCGGKTTFLRALARGLSSGTNYLGGMRRFRVCLADERGELFNRTFFKDCTVDRLEMCPKAFAVECATALLSPEVIICDEIKSEAEADALCKAWSYGIVLAASCHGTELNDVIKRRHMKRLIDCGVFGTVCSLGNSGASRISEINKAEICTPTQP